MVWSIDTGEAKMLLDIRFPVKYVIISQLALNLVDICLDTVGKTVSSLQHRSLSTGVMRQIAWLRKIARVFACAKTFARTKF